MKKLLCSIFKQSLIIGLFLTIFPLNAAAAEGSFVVTAFNEFGESGYSEEVSCDMQPGQTVTVAWNSCTGATGYNLYYKAPWHLGYITTRMATTVTLTLQVTALEIFGLECTPVLQITCPEE